MVRSEAEDADGLSPVKDDNEAVRRFIRRTLLIFDCADYISWRGIKRSWKISAGTSAPNRIRSRRSIKTWRPHFAARSCFMGYVSHIGQHHQIENAHPQPADRRFLEKKERGGHMRNIYIRFLVGTIMIIAANYEQIPRKT